MQTRRDFLRNAALLSGTAFVSGSIPEAISRAFAIDPPEGSTFHDAEHVVILMQENRSFDHAFGCLRGVRGFRDPHPHVLPNGKPVWFQTDADGKTFSPFHLDIEETNVTWIGGLPHSWPDQVDARNGGHYDKWLIAKARKDYPLTMGYYTRHDLPFYYALADAFTVGDQAFCSSLTGTTPNRLFLWTGTIREDEKHPARVQNGDTDYDQEAAWTTYLERLQDAGVTWRLYQNELSIDSGLQGEYDSWLANFTDNPIEWFTQHRVRFGKSRRAYLAKLEANLEHKIPLAEGETRTKLEGQLAEVRKERAEFSDAAWEALSPRDRALHENAFCCNEGDPDYRSLEVHEYEDRGTARKMNVPKGDVLYQFRKDVESGNLPAVSWLIAPENFSDHPSSGWYGAWYLSEAMNILTKDPEVWKKTIFILCYDENDGYFDHYPPFVAPMPGKPETGKVSSGIDTTVDVSDAHGRTSSIGLGYRCPFVIASPWTRGGFVNSQVTDHTSVLMFLETWLEGKGKQVRETNISDWRRTVCCDLTSYFRPYRGEQYELPKPLERNASVERIHRARFRDKMKSPAPIEDAEVAKVNVSELQEPGTRPSCALPYELEVNAIQRGGELVLQLEAGSRRFGRKSAGSPFNAYSYGAEMQCRSYAVRAGDTVEDTFPISGSYNVRVDGPNGFLRQFQGSRTETNLSIGVRSQGLENVVEIENRQAGPVTVAVTGAQEETTVPAGRGLKLKVSAKEHQGWYDFTVTAGTLRYRYAGRIETGRDSISDPAMA